jgi:hypothetical protein
VPWQRAQPSSNLIHEQETAVFVVARHNRVPELLLLPSAPCGIWFRGIRGQTHNVQIKKLLLRSAAGHGVGHLLHGRVQLFERHTLQHVGAKTPSAVQLVTAKHVLRKFNTKIGPKSHHRGEVAKNTTDGLVTVAVVDANLQRKVFMLCLKLRPLANCSFLAMIAALIISPIS